MTKAIYLDHTGTITQENCEAVQKAVMRIVQNSVLKAPQEALSYWWSNLKQMEEASYLEAFKTEDEPDAKELFEKCRLPVYLLTNIGLEYVQESMRHNNLKPAGIICGDMVKTYKPHKEVFIISNLASETAPAASLF